MGHWTQQYLDVSSTVVTIRRLYLLEMYVTHSSYNGLQKYCQMGHWTPQYLDVSSTVVTIRRLYTSFKCM